MSRLFDQRSHRAMHVLLLCAWVVCSAAALGQRGNADLSETEIEQIREAKMDPSERVLIFSRIIDTRIDRIQHVLADVRAQGRAEDIHQNMDEISGLVNELEDNIDEYAQLHRDLRKSLPKLVTSTERWQSILRQPPANDRYKVARNLALEAVADVQDQAKTLLPEQTQYFKDHPPSKDPEPKQYEVEQSIPHRRDH